MADRYEIIGRLGRGGLGAVYRARDNVMGREVAVKRLLPPEESTSNEEASIDSLKREAAALARFQHPNIVSVYSLEEDSDGPFVVTELIEGENLHNIVINGALPYKDFEAIAEQTLEPLIAAQKADLMHRDIKPANIMLSELPSGKFIVKILDFGLAKFSQKPSTQTLDLKGTFLGSIDFIAPEQLELAPLDHRTDLYSLGCVLYYCLTQDSPFAGANAAETSQNHLNHKCKHLSELRPDVPGPVADWVMTLVERNPDDRPETATIALKQFEEAKKGISPAKIRLKEKKITDSIDVVQATESIHAAEGARAAEAESSKGGVRKDTGRVLRTGPVKRADPASSGPPSRSVTRPQEGGGNSRKTGLIIGAGGFVLLLVILAFVFSGGGDKPQEPNPDKLAGGDTPGDSPETASAEFPKEPLPTPGSVDLPELDGLQSGSQPRVTRGLVASFKANLGTYHYDLETLARPGQRVAAWRNLASPNRRSYLVYDWKDLKGEFLPQLDRVGSDDYPVLNGLFRAVQLTNQDFMQSPGKLGDFSKGLTCFIVGRFNSVEERILQFVPETYDGRLISLEATYGETIDAKFKAGGSGGTAVVQSVPWKSGNLGIITYLWNPTEGIQKLRGVTATGERFDSGNQEVGKTELPYTKMVLGPRKFEEGRIEEPRTFLFEFSTYDRPLSAPEMTATENQLASKYFGLKFDRVNLTGASKGKAPSGKAKQAGPGPGAAGGSGIPEEGLVSHYRPEQLVYHKREGGVEADPGDSVIFWKIGKEPGNALAHQFSKTDQVPTLYEAGEGNEFGLKPGVRLLDFSPDTALVVQKFTGLEQSDALSVVTVAQVQGEDTGPIVRLDTADRNYSWISLNPNDKGIAGKVGRDPTTKERDIERLKFDRKRVAIYSLIWDGKKGEMALQARLSGGEIVKAPPAKTYRGKVDLTRFHLGAIKYNEYHTLYSGKIGDTLIYDRALTEAERKNLEDHFAAKYFQKP